MSNPGPRADRDAANPAHSSPTVMRRRLAAELRRYRDLFGLTIEDVAERLEWSSAKISRIENARVRVLPRDVKFLFGVYGLTDTDDAWQLLLTLARESRTRGWWHQHGDAVPDWFEFYVGLEAEATTISAYDAEFIPGLFQTAEYARAIHRADLLTATDEEIEGQVQVRMARQARLKAADSPQVWCVLNEAVIRRRVGGRAIMHDQLTRLLEATELPSVTLQVVPFDVGAHPSMDGALILLGFQDETDPNIVYIEYQTGAIYLEKPDEVRRYKLIFDHLRATALSVDASRTLIAGRADELA